MPCLAYRDVTTGQPLILREAIAEHVFRLMDSTNSELLIKVPDGGWRDRGGGGAGEAGEKGVDRAPH